MCYDNISFTREQLALLEDRDQTIGDLQFSLDEKDAQLEEVRGGEGEREREREREGERERERDYYNLQLLKTRKMVMR